MKIPPEGIAEILSYILVPFLFIGYIYGGMYFFRYLTELIIIVGRVLLGY
jgi:hypothetical protein